MWAGGDPLAIALALVRDPRRLLRSLLAVVDTDEDPQAWPYMELARACLEMSDCATIVQDLKVDGSPVESQDKRFVMLFDRGDLKVLHLCAKLERLRSHLRHQVSTEYPLRESGIVFYLIGINDLSAEHLPLGE